jgi:hypothetical protein
MEKKIIEIQKVLNSCYRDLANHALQKEVLSPQIKKFRDKLNELSSLIEEIDAEHLLAKKSETQHFFTRAHISQNEKEDLIKVAYALSRFDFYLFNEILKTHYNQTEVIRFLAKKFNIKPSTLKNYRDMFDPYVDQQRSNRKGRHQKKLEPKFKDRKSAWDGEDEDFIKAEIEKIITDTGNPEPDIHPSYTEF